MSPPKQKGGQWTEQVLHSFAGGTDGANPNGGLLLDNRGSIYGTTPAGGNQGCKTDSGIGCGTAFELKSPVKKGGAWTEQILHRFTGGNDGSAPNGGLIFDRKRALNGTAGGGGTGKQGVVFRFKVNGNRWTEEVLHSFSELTKGANPQTGLISGNTGDLYGTALGGEYFRGVLFRLRPMVGGGWAFSDMYTFTGPPDGSYPEARLIFDKSGNLYSTTAGGGTGQACQGGCGTVFRVSP